MAEGHGHPALAALLLGLVATGMYEVGANHFAWAFTNGRNELGSPWMWLAYAVFYNSLIFYAILVAIALLGISFLGVLLMLLAFVAFVLIPAEVVGLNHAFLSHWLYFPPSPSQFHQFGEFGVPLDYVAVWPFMGHRETLLPTTLGWLYLVLVIATVWEVYQRKAGSNVTTRFFKYVVSGTVLLLAGGVAYTYGA